MEIKQDLTTVNYTAKKSRSILAIILHSMGGTYAGSISWFKNPASHVSAHYCISDSGEITQCVLEENIGWHAGIFDEPIADWLRPNPNYVSIGIELEDKKDPNWSYPLAQREALAWLVDDLCKRWSIPKDKEHILLHKNLNPSRKHDPIGTFDINWVLGDNYMVDVEKLKKDFADEQKRLLDCRGDREQLTLDLKASKLETETLTKEYQKRLNIITDELKEYKKTHPDIEEKPEISVEPTKEQVEANLFKADRNKLLYAFIDKLLNKKELDDLSKIHS